MKFQSKFLSDLLRRHIARSSKELQLKSSQFSVLVYLHLPMSNYVSQAV